VILDQGVVPDALYVIESGVVTVTMAQGDDQLEVGRMGPGEVMGETGIVDQSSCLARFSALTDCVVYHVHFKDLEPWLDEHGELREIMARLARFRDQKRQEVIAQKPAAAAQRGFIHWLRRRRDAGRR